MQTFLQGLSITGVVLFTVFFVGLCIFVHELGHFLAALRRGLYVERFSIGLGWKLWGFRRGEVEYVVSTFPFFGGYVALPQLDPSDAPQAREGQALPPVSPLDRILTVVAGPLTNVVFGFLLALVVWWIGVYRPAQATACDVVSVVETSPEYQAGLRPGDRIVEVNGKGFSRGWAEISERIVLSAGPVTLRVRRGHEVLDLRYRPAPNPVAEGIGYPFFEVRVPTVVHRTLSGSPAAAAGLECGDVILRVNGELVADTSAFIGRVMESKGAELELQVVRGETVLPAIRVRAKPERTKDGKDAYRIGAVLDDPRVLYHPTPWAQFVYVIVQTRNTLRLLFVKESLVKPRHLSGPVGILHQIYMKIYLGGFREGLWFVVFVSFSLGLINLLPIPVLDGGHVVLAVAEAVARRRLPAQVAYGVQTAFAILLIGFMLYITYYDVVRVGVAWRMLHPTQAQPAAPP